MRRIFRGERQSDIGCNHFHRRMGFIVLAVTAGLAAALCLGCPGDGGGGGGDGEAWSGGVSGRLSLPERISLDQDTRDQLNPQSAVNNTAPGQALANLSTAIGHVDRTLDRFDIFEVSLKNGDEVVLKMGDTIGADLDLYLYKNGSTVDQSESYTSPIEVVTASGGDGTYVALVHAWMGGAIYNLSTGVSTAGAGTGDEDLDLVIGEVLVTFKEDGPGSIFKNMPVGSGRPAAVRAAVESAAAERGLATAAVDPRGLALLSFAVDGELDGRMMTPADVSKDQLDQARQATLAMVDRLNSDPAVAFAEPNRILHADLAPATEPYYKHQWSLPGTYAEQAWDITTGSAAVVVAVIDTGLLYNHPDISASVLRDPSNGNAVVGYDFISDTYAANDGGGRDSDPLDTGDKGSGDARSSFHGTHVAGTIAAQSGNSQGIAGLSWASKIMPVRVLGRGGGTTYDIAQAIYYAAGLANDSGALPRVSGSVKKADVINMSLGGAGACTAGSAFANAISAARTAGVIVIAAAGNSDTTAAHSPASCPGVVGVAATDFVGDRAPYSNYGSSNMALAAPGGDTSVDRNNDGYPDGILSTLGDDSSGGLPTYVYGFYQGTSMAAPHMAGVVALMRSVNTSLTPTMLDNLIAGTNADPNVTSITNQPKRVWSNTKGYGIIDVEKAVKMARYLAPGPAPTGPVLGLAPAELDFGFSATSLATVALNRGIGSLGAISVSDYSAQPFAAWLSNTIAGATITFTVNRAALAADGNYTATVTVNSVSGGSDTARISVAKGAPTDSDAGMVYVLLINLVDGGTSYQYETNAADGYAYSFTGVPPGQYMLAAGTDLNEDFQIGDNGEIFGVYSSLEDLQPVTIVAGWNGADYDFPLQFVGLPLSTTGKGPAEAAEPGRMVFQRRSGPE